MAEGIEGLLLVDKPAGVTSHDAVLLARRVYGERSIGHLGTLDPFATGLLVLLLGRSTRLATFIDNDPKVYVATIRFGSETTTDDCTGEVTREAPPPAAVAIHDALPSLTGQILQIPPDFSAKSVNGTRAYDAARRGEPLELAPANVIVHEWLIEREGGNEIVVRITCAGGTYIRALARDLGRAAGSAAHLTALRRCRSGPFDVADAATFDVLRTSPPALTPLKVIPGA